MKKFSKFEINEKAVEISPEDAMDDLIDILRDNGYRVKGNYEAVIQMQEMIDACTETKRTILEIQTLLKQALKFTK